MIIALLTAAFIISAFLTHFLCNSSSGWQIFDHPNERSLHDRPIPRSGGLAILAAIFPVWLAMAVFSGLHNYVAWIGGGALAVAVVSFLDDRATVRPVYRLAVHALVAGMLVRAGFIIPSLDIPGAIWHWPYAVAIIASFLLIIWMINLYNFMDGMDGFAAGMTVTGFGFLALLGWSSGDFQFAAVNMTVAAAACGFLFFNFPPAKIFMGDVGSSTLGLLAAALSLWGARKNIFPLWAAVLIFSPFIFDSSITLVRRLFRGEIVWKPHKTHYYQKLVQAGWGHRKTVLAEYAVMLGCGVSALLCMHVTVAIQAVILILWVIFYLIFFSWVSWYESKRRPDFT